MNEKRQTYPYTDEQLIDEASNKSCREYLLNDPQGMYRFAGLKKNALYQHVDG